MAKREISFNAQAFLQNIQHQKCKKKLKGALAYLEWVMKREAITDDMISCRVYLKGKVGREYQSKLLAA